MANPYQTFISIVDAIEEELVKQEVNLATLLASDAVREAHPPIHRFIGDVRAAIAQAREDDLFGFVELRRRAQNIIDAAA